MSKHSPVMSFAAEPELIELIEKTRQEIAGTDQSRRRIPSSSEAIRLLLHRASTVSCTTGGEAAEIQTKVFTPPEGA